MMRAHIVAEDGEILNTVMVDKLEAGIVDASIGGGPGDKIVNNVVVRQTHAVSDADFNAAVLAQLEAIDRKSIRSIREGDAQRISAYEAQAAALRAQLRK